MRRSKRKARRRGGASAGKGSGRRLAEPPSPPLDVEALNRADLLQAAGALIACLVAYALTACPHVHVGDSPELAAAAATFGVAHPPGYPLYTLVTGLGVRALFWLDPAHAANVLSGLYAAGTVALLWLLLRRLRCAPAACWFAAACLALGSTFWSQATVAEVYTFDTLALLAVLHAAVTLATRPHKRWWLVTGLCLGLWMGHRLNNLLYLPAPVLLWLACGGWRGSPRLIMLAAGLAAAALPLLYLPLASARDPLVDMGDPETLARFWAVVTAAPFRGLLGGVPPAVALRRVGLLLISLPLEMGLASLAALIAAWQLWRRGRAERLLLAALTLVLVVGVGFSALYNILDYDAYLLPAFVALACLGGLGATALLDRIDTLQRPELARLSGVALVACGLTGLAINLGDRNLGQQDHVRLQAEDTLASVPSNALLLVHGDTASTALDYLQAVERRAPGVVVVRIENLTPWYTDHLARRFPKDPWPPLDGAASPGAHAHRIITALGRARPVYLTLSVDPRTVLPPGSPYGLVSRGLVREVRRKGERVRLGRQALAASSRLLQSVARMAAPGPRADMDLRSIYLQYALALLQTANQLHKAGFRTRARRCLEVLLFMKPNLHDIQLSHEVMVRTGRVVPLLRLQRQARAALAALERGAIPRKRR